MALSVDEAGPTSLNGRRNSSLLQLGGPASSQQTRNPRPSLCSGTPTDVLFRLPPACHTMHKKKKEVGTGAYIRRAGGSTLSGVIKK